MQHPWILIWALPHQTNARIKSILYYCPPMGQVQIPTLTNGSVQQPRYISREDVIACL